MSKDDTGLTCPRCGASYQQVDTSCGQCGGVLSPTGYSPYGEAQVVALPAVVKPSPMPPLLSRALVAGTDRLHTRAARMRTWRYYLPVGIIVITLIVVILGGQSNRPTNQPTGTVLGNFPTMIAVTAMPAITSTPIRPVACQPPPETFGTAPNVMINYTLNISTTKGRLRAKMYYPGTAAVESALLDNTSGGHISVGTATITISTNDNIITGFAPLNLPFQCGRVLMPVRNGQISDDEITIIKSNDAANAVSFAQNLGYSYTAVGQLISGYDVLGALSAGDSVKSAWESSAP